MRALCWQNSATCDQRPLYSQVFPQWARLCASAVTAVSWLPAIHLGFNAWGKFATIHCLRPYHLEYTSSRLITEVKQG
jgi:hypothetical protein